MKPTDQPSPERRSFLSSVNLTVTSLAALAFGSAAAADGQSKSPAPFEPARHDKDDWMEIPSKHRLVFDTTAMEGFAEALAFAGNYQRVNRVDYGLQDSDLSVIVVARHRATPFAYNDAIWAKYGEILSKPSKFEDPKTKEAPKKNVFEVGDYGELLPNRGTTVDSLTKRGLRLAVCSTATRGMAGMIAKATGSKADDVNNELISNLLNNGRMVPAGIVAVSRAQERGYTLVAG
ncbi:MAG: hypothetical protein KGN84_00800 [Acidobacteriota bacterium]|nr:hypothetical protein [Acidobacteriota bacterium]